MRTLSSYLKIILLFLFLLGCWKLSAQVQGNTPVCVGDTLYLSISSTSGTVTWTGPNGHMGTGFNWNRQIRNIADSGWYFVHVSSSQGTVRDSIFIQTLGCPRCTKREGDNWFFGDGVGLNFSSGSPAVLSNSAINTNEGSASISDPQGNLLFYTDGVNVWNRNHQIMPNGTGLFGNSTATQSGVIVPHPGNLDLYYIFTVDYIRGNNGLNYSIVDMRLNGGLGNVTTKNINLFLSTTEKITAARHANGYEYWLISHPYNTSTYNCYHVGLNGLNSTAVVSTAGTLHGSTLPNKIGALKVSPNGDKVACAIFRKNIFEVLDFNSSTGRLSNAVTLLSSIYTESYGVEFSPDGTKLYGTTLAAPSKLIQFDLTRGSAAQIVSNAVILKQNALRYWYGQLQLGPDGKIYVARFNSQVGSRTLDVIDFPNNASTSIGYRDNGLNLGITGWCRLGLPNFIPSTFQQLNPVAQYGCQGQAGAFVADSIPGADYMWFSPGNVTHNGRIWRRNMLALRDTGWYTISALVGGCTFVDSVYLDSLPPALTYPFFGPDTLICSNTPTSFLLNIAQPSATSYRWQNGSTSSSLSVTQTGLYWVEIVNACDTLRDTIRVDILPVPLPVNLGPNQALCAGDTIRLNASQGNGLSYLWDNGNTMPSRSPITQSTVAWVQISNPCGVETDTIVLNFSPIPQVSISPGDSIICAGDSLSISPAIVGNSWSWSDNYAQLNRSLTSSGNYVLSATNSCGTAQDSIQLDVLVPPLPFSLGNDTTLCPGQFLTFNLSQVDARYLWFDNDTLPNKFISNPGWVWADVYNVCGNYRDSILITAATAPYVQLGNDTSLCSGDSFAIQALVRGASWLWNDGSADSLRTFVADGWYWVDATNSCGTMRDSIMIDVLIPPSPFSLGPDTTLCPGQALTFNLTQSDANYRWYDNDSLPAKTTSIPGWVWAEVYNVCGSYLDSLFITSEPAPFVNLGNDTSLCLGDSLAIQTLVSDASWSWNDGNTDSLRTFVAGGLYWVDATNFCGTMRDSILIDVRLAAPVVDLGSDSSLCEGDSITIGAYSPAAGYVWQDGLRDSVRTIFTNGLYIQAVRNACGTSLDSVDLTFLPQPDINLGNDTVLCEGASLSLDLRSSVIGSIQWDNGSSDSLRTIQSGGLYWAVVSTSCGQLRDSLIVTEVRSPLPFYLGPDTLLCPGDSFVLNGYQNDNFNYRWLDDGSDFWEKTISSSGLYTLEISNRCNVVTDDIEVILLPIPTIDLGTDTILCEGEQLTLLHESQNLVNYFWSNGEIAPEIRVTSSGYYSLRAYNACDTVVQGIEVSFEPCECTFFMPNAFTPNSDRHNEQFGPKYDCPIRNYEMTIFDRWGKIIYISNDPNKWWDGTHQTKGGHVPEGVYVWKVSFEGSRYREYLPYNFVGTVTLIR